MALCLVGSCHRDRRGKEESSDQEGVMKAVFLKGMIARLVVDGLLEILGVLRGITWYLGWTFFT